MAATRVFVSSTYYDLKHIRSSMEVFVESLGYDAVLSEKGAIAYSPDQALDESCYREVKNCEIYVLIIGGRYGSEVSETRTSTPKSFFDRYESVTKMEYNAALKDDVPIYILIERAVYAEYQTFLKNRSNENVIYAHVDSINVFHFIDFILAQPRNNPIQTFDKYADIESWLRLQWSGLFRELLKERSNEAQLSDLATQVNQLSEVNQTLRRYLEEVVTKLAPENEATSLIKAEDARLSEAEILHKLNENRFVRFICGGSKSMLQQVRSAIENAKTINGFIDTMKAMPEVSAARLGALNDSELARSDFNDARQILGRTKLMVDQEETPSIKPKAGRPRASPKKSKRSKV